MPERKSEMIEVLLTKNQTTEIDLIDSDLVSTRKYHAHGRKGDFYAARTGWKGFKRTAIYLHVEIMERIISRPLTDDEEVDHVDLNKLNNKRGNLRIASHPQNMKNNPITIRNTSGYKGVSWIERLKKYQVDITVDGERYYLGVFSDLEEAARAYNVAAKEHHKEFASLNSITGDQRDI